MNRMGLVDFWYYVNDEFHFKDGHMLLRGSNGSGKSVTMQSFIPLILDGNKSSERLDPFGTRSRKIENYLLEEGSNRDQRIGYLYLEFKRENSDIYKTIGMGLHARKGRPVDAWYFIIENNQRINHDFSLMSDQIAITKLQLKNLIGDEQLINTQSEYMERVNQSLFGFESTDSYKEAIALLLKLRTPKLSNSLKPTVINEMLRDSLQPLSEDDLRPMSEAISNMDSIQDILDNLNQSYHGAKAIQLRYEQYNYDILASKIEKFEREKSKLEQLEKNSLYIQKQMSKDSQLIAQKELDLVQYEQEQTVLKEEQNSLMDNDLKRLNDDTIRLQEELLDYDNNIDKKQKLKDNREQQCIEIDHNMKQKKNDCDTEEIEVKEAIKELDDIYRNTNFSEHLILKDSAWKQLKENYDYRYVMQILQKESNDLNEGISEFHRYSTVEENIKSFYDEKERLDTKKEQSEKELENNFQLLEEEKSFILEKIDQWNQQNKVFFLEEDKKKIIFQCVQDYEDEPALNHLRKILIEVEQASFNKLFLKKHKEQALLHEIFQQKEEKNRELQQWQKQADPQPECSDALKMHRQKLKNQEIAFVSLYQLIEYSDEVTMELRNCFEEMLVESGLLNAIIINNNDIDKVDVNERFAEHYLLSSKKVNELSSHYLKGTSMREIEESFKAFLNSAGIQNFEQIKIQDYTYQHGLLYGSLSGKKESIFVGKKARAQYRQNMIDLLVNQCEKLLEEYETQNQICVEIDEQIELLNVEKANFPNLSKLNDIFQNGENMQLQIQNTIASIELVEKRIEKIAEQLKQITQKLRLLAEKLSIAVDEKMFIERKNFIQDYERILHHVISIHDRYVANYELYNSYRNRWEEQQEYLDDINYELTQLQNKYQMTNSLLISKKKQLADKGFDKIKERMDYVNERIIGLPKMILECATWIAASKERLHTLEKNHQSIKTEIVEQESLKNKYQSIMEDEIKLYYVVEKSEDKETNIFLQAKEKINNYKWKYRRENSSELLHESFYNHRGALQEYNPTLTSIHLTQEQKVDDIKERLDIIAKHGGKRLSFMDLIVKLERDIEVQKTLLVDQDRELYEDILVNTISKKIRNRIRNSHSWVTEMNRYMDAMNTSSGLKLNLSWKAKRAENDEEMDTREVVDLLEKDVNILKEKDLQRLSRHFRSKIETARKIRDYDDNTLSFHQLMREVMDYRKWFEFKLLSQKTGEVKKELTNNAFYAYSGGEKAMSMYVPLFSAIAAKYASAREDAPMLIALDEAFAGVDEKNIDNMFALIKRFNFDYIMNSQVLWGDYPSVTSLAIYELFRPENAKYVTIIAYEWNGLVKRLKS